MFALSLTLACQDDTTAAPSDTSESSTSEDGPSESTTDESGSDEESSAEETETGEPGPYCGDGNLDILEECDDGNNDDDDGCSNTCESDCGIEFWLDITLPEGWFDVQLMRASPEGRIELAGDVAAAGQIGRLRYASYVDSEFETAIQTAPLGNSGTLELPQTHQISAVEITEQGDLLALGVTTEVMVVDEAPVESYWLARFAGDDLSAVWRVEIPADGPDDRPLDLAVLEGGDPVITMTVAVADNDRDIQVQRRAFADGAEVWTASHSGEFNGGWSFDEAGRVAVGAGDRLWVAGIVRVDWQTYNATLFELDPADGAALWTGVPLPDPGSSYEQRIWDLAAGPDGTVALGINMMGPATQYHFGAAFLYVDQELAWSLTPEQLPWDDGGEPYVSPRVAIGADGDVLVTGSYTHDFDIATAARPWVVALAPDGTQLCAARVGEGTDAAVVPRNGYFHGGRGALNLDTYGPGGMGPGSDGNWLVGLRGP
ncbi:hypothetical protein [Enhygromyxa salina]|uniref:hypothetical protein n=1 Tax=Enhygromyxa salina TaxID=215803 RepID=UPI0015E5C174|nr:hypothetical protein [Enhygromyxa salina]